MDKFIVMFLTVLGLGGSSVAYAQQFATPVQQSQENVCEQTIRSLIKDGGVAFPIRDVVSYTDQAMSGEKRMSLLYKYDYGFLGPDSFWDPEIFKKWQKLASGQSWVVIANRSILPKVQSREWPQALKSYDYYITLETTIWFALVVAADDTGNCPWMVAFKGVFKENDDLPSEVWPMLKPLVMLPPLEDK